MRFSTAFLVTRPFLQCLTNESRKLNSGAVISDLLGESFTSYGCVVLTNNPALLPRSFTLTNYPSNMGRSLIAVELSVNGRTLFAGTSHLESLKSAPIRKQQLEFASKRFQGDNDCFFMGDFNLDSPEENQAMKETLSEFQDTWELLRPSDPGKTFDTTSNPMLRNYGYEKARYDRVMFKPTNWKAERIKMIGKKAFGKEKDIALVVSDHYGLLADFSVPSTK